MISSSVVMQRVVIGVVILALLACGKSNKGACKLDQDCPGEQRCWCDFEMLVQSGQCLDSNDLPSGQCISRRERAKRTCLAQGKPENCDDLAYQKARASIAANTNAGGLQLTVSRPKIPPRRQAAGDGRRNSDQKNASEDLSTDLSDDSGEGATLGIDDVYSVYSSHAKELADCLHSNGTNQATVAIVIDGASGRVSLVKVNGQTSGGTWSCLSLLLRGMQFPKIRGPQTRAEFDIGT